MREDAAGGGGVDMVTLLTPLPGVIGPRRAKALREQRGIETVEDLLWFLPRRYLDRQGDMADLSEGSYLVVIGEVVKAAERRMKARRGTMLTATVRTSTGDLDLTFFRSYGHTGRLVPGAVGLFAGTVGRFNGRWQLTHPSYELFSSSSPALDALAETGPVPRAGADAVDALEGGLAVRPLYPVYLEVKGVDSWTISGLVASVLATLEAVPDPLPESLRRRRGLPGFVEAMTWMHLPTDREEPRRATRRLKYDEALIMQLVLGMRRRAQASSAAIPRTARAGGLLEAFDARLPFELTPGQRQVGEEIAADLARPHPMHRLLQGEVGSGKTVVALRAILSVIDSGGQAALLAPTEVLAAQHHRSITAMLGDLAEGGLLGGTNDLARGTRVALLTGGQSTAARRAATLAAASGEAGLVIGTHALLQKHVQLADLGLVVVDEQHRFGVEQRDALRGKAATPPHVLVMTATPIPRTVAMTVFGDMETSVLRELPAGRAPIATHVVDNPAWYERIWRRIAEEVAAGHQVYVVCPRIGADDPAAADAAEDDGGSGDASDHAGDGSGLDPEAGAPTRSVLEVFEEVRGRDELAGCRIEMLHGRMSADDKDAVMTAFGHGHLDVLVSTTVIEVGVDVPNATLMVVLDADRFGIAQLHQLRGRVGRGQTPGLCLLVAQGAHAQPRPAGEGEPGAGALQRLREVAATTDGFELARLDLDTRREGDILGARQSGGTSLRLLSLRGGDERLIEQAREDAGALLDVDPSLRTHPELAHLVATLIDETQAAFLERG